MFEPQSTRFFVVRIRAAHAVRARQINGMILTEFLVRCSENRALDLHPKVEPDLSLDGTGNMTDEHVNPFWLIPNLERRARI